MDLLASMMSSDSGLEMMDTSESKQKCNKIVDIKGVVEVNRKQSITSNRIPN